MGLFSFGSKNRIEELEREIEKLERDLLSKEKEVENLINELEKSNKLSPKQLQIFEKNLNDSRREAAKYKNFIQAYKINCDKPLSKYRVDISKLFSGSKFDEIIKKLNEKDINFIDQLNLPDFISTISGSKNEEEAIKKVSEYLKGNISWEILTYMNRGEKISKVFSKYRKFHTILSSLNYEYMDEIVDFDFLSLKDYNFSIRQIDEYSKLRDEYFEENRTIISEAIK